MIKKHYNLFGIFVGFISGGGHVMEFLESSAHPENPNILKHNIKDNVFEHVTKQRNTNHVRK